MKKIVIVLLLLLIGFSLRFQYLDSPLWYDEACSWATSTDKAGIMHNLLNIDLQHTPLYFIFLKFWMKFFGQAEVAMRSFSLIFGLLTIPLAFIAGNKISKNGFWAGLICAVSPLLVIFSTEIRMYSLVVFLVLLSINYLLDFEQKGDKKSLSKLIGVNILIPYTFVGAILYNLSLIVCYSIYLFKSNREKFIKYIRFEVIEWVFLVPYFILISYYAKMRSVFVISHEGILRFSHIVDVIRNFFGATIDSNIYWVSNGIYTMNLWFTLFVIIPCIYFIAGYIRTFKNDNKFLKVLSSIILFNFILAIIFSVLKVNVFTARYVLYLFPPVVILALTGMNEKLNLKHFKIFLTLFVLICAIFSYKNSYIMKQNKLLALKSTALECDELGLTSEDIIILPFGADAPYYFRNLTRPRVFDSDLHKTARNPYGVYYDDADSQIMAGKGKYQKILDKINQDSVFSRKYYDYFIQNVTNTVQKGRYVILAMYDTDNNAIVNIKDLRKQINEVNSDNILDALFKKYMCDTIAMLNMNFVFIKSYKKDNFTYYIFQKI